MHAHRDHFHFWYGTEASRQKHIHHVVVVVRLLHVLYRAPDRPGLVSLGPALLSCCWLTGHEVAAAKVPFLRPSVRPRLSGDKWLAIARGAAARPMLSRHFFIFD